MKFTVENPDEKRSPYTGMTREHWISISHFFLEGIFEHVEKIEDPIFSMRQRSAIHSRMGRNGELRRSGLRDLPGAF